VPKLPKNSKKSNDTVEYQNVNHYKKQPKSQPDVHIIKLSLSVI
jgi:hypothetical protein